MVGVVLLSALPSGFPLPRGMTGRVAHFPSGLRIKSAMTGLLSPSPESSPIKGEGDMIGVVLLSIPPCGFPLPRGMTAAPISIHPSGLRIKSAMTAYGCLCGLMSVLGDDVGVCCVFGCRIIQCGAEFVWNCAIFHLSV